MIDEVVTDGSAPDGATGGRFSVGGAGGRSRLVGWYIHHQGAGHLTRFLAVRPLLDAEVVVFSSAPRPSVLPERTQWVALAADDAAETRANGEPLDPNRADPSAGGLLHWAPLGHRGHSSRLATIAHALAERTFDAVVVDVSAEVTLLVRLLGVRPVVFVQPGRRDDRAHQLARDAAAALIAPWPGDLYRPEWLQPAADRVHFTGGISRFEGRRRRAQPRAGEVLLLMGSGGSSVGPAEVMAAALATPDVSWRALGRPWSDGASPAVTVEWLDDPFDALCQADVVVSWAGQNSVADLAAVGADAIVIGQPRPFDEQTSTVAVLAEAGLAVALDAWPPPADWADLVARARALRPDWARWNVTGAAGRAADVIAAVAAW